MKVLKRSKDFVFYDDEKLVKSMLKANAETGEELSPKEAAYLADVVLGRLVKNHDIITTEQIREGVIEALTEKGLTMTARQYREYVKKDK